MCECRRVCRNRRAATCIAPQICDRTRGGTIVAHGTTNWLIVSLGPMVLTAVIGHEPLSAAAFCPRCSQCENDSVEAGSINAADESGSRIGDHHGDSRSAMSAATTATERGGPCKAPGFAALLPWHRCQTGSAATGGTKSGRDPIPPPAPQYSPSAFHPVPTRPVFSPRGFEPLFIPGYNQPIERPNGPPEIVPPGETIPAPNSNASVRGPVPFPEPPKPGTGWEIPDEPPPAPLPDAILSSRSSRTHGSPGESRGLAGQMVALPDRPTAVVPSPNIGKPQAGPPAGSSSSLAIPGHLPSVGLAGSSMADSWIFKAKPTGALSQSSQSQPILEVERPRADRSLRR